jgi:hypothetical protein
VHLLNGCDVQINTCCCLWPSFCDKQSLVVRCSLYSSMRELTPNGPGPGLRPFKSYYILVPNIE